MCNVQHAMCNVHIYTIEEVMVMTLTNRYARAHFAGPMHLNLIKDSKDL